jgi:dTDP-4-dehydrorhamnose 3,5-epimerase
MKFTETELKGVWLIEPVVHEDKRGFFLESFSSREMDSLGLPGHFVQDNHSRSLSKGVVRGIHFQKPPFAQSKLVRVVRGSVFDVVVDLRTASKTFGTWVGVTLSDINKKMLFIPKGFGHGYCTLTEDSEFLYKVDAYYSAQHDAGVRWNDPDVGIQWPVTDPTLSQKDLALPLLKDLLSPFQL